MGAVGSCEALDKSFKGACRCSQLHRVVVSTSHLDCGQHFSAPLSLQTNSLQLHKCQLLDPVVRAVVDPSHAQRLGLQQA